MSQRSHIISNVITPIAGALGTFVLALGVAGAGDSSDIRIHAPTFVLEGVPVTAVQIEVLDEQGQRDRGFRGDARLEGVQVVTDDPRADAADLENNWEDGLLRLETNRGTGHKVFITQDVIRVTISDGRTASHTVHRMPGWASLLPAVIAVVLAVALRETLVALFAAVWTGMALLSTSQGGWLTRIADSFVQTVDTAIVGQLVSPNGDTAHVQIILFTLFLGCLVGVMSAGGGTEALVNRLTPVTRSRRGGQLTTCFLGLVVFFDDYANSLLLGSTMRPVTDRLRISREKLAFLVDATAAPVAGLALVSTWVGFEVGLIGDSFARLAETSPDVSYSGDAYGTFLATFPYRFYPLFLLAFVGMVAWSGRDFGPMRRAERRAVQRDLRSDVSVIPQAGDGSTKAGTMWNAVVPLGVLLGGIVIGFWMTGRTGVEIASPSLWEIVSHADSNRVLLVSSFMASVTAIVMAVVTRSSSLVTAVAAWLEGARSMLLGAAILVLAWAVAMVCDADHLNTAGYLVEVTTGRLDIAWMPAVAFLLSAAVSFATGTSWATMGLLIPLLISVTYGLMVDDATILSGAGIERHPLMLATVGSVLAGSIFGDHCSPISDTTVLSSVASDCDHLSHVATQLPYAAVVGLIALFAGCIPAGFGVPWLITIPTGLVACWLVARFIGHPLEC